MLLLNTQAHVIVAVVGVHADQHGPLDLEGDFGLAAVLLEFLTARDVVGAVDPDQMPVSGDSLNQLALNCCVEADVLIEPESWGFSVSWVVGRQPFRYARTGNDG
jgi:hypothetical protein